MASKSTAEKIISEATSPYHVLIGKVYAMNKPVPLVRAGLVRKPKRVKKAKKAGSRMSKAAKAALVEKLRAGKARAKARRAAQAGGSAYYEI